MSLKLLWEHLYIVICSEALAIAVGLPLGIICYLYPKPKKAIMQVVDILQTIPTLALLGIIMVFAGAGKITVIIGIALYSLLPIVRNTNLGLVQVNPGVKEAARGMGMSKMYRLFNVELPLAFPIVFTGIRIATVNAVGSAVFATFVGGGGIGFSIYNAIKAQNMGQLMKSTAALVIIAVALDFGMGLIEGSLHRGAEGKKKKGAHLSKKKA
ncbi:MAG: ABC transporter permease [Clostridiales bacterium]|jgi:osmoprotectant transport system permease protein|nr:ABC transporter permease [Clostridiales bacterium]